MAEYIEREATCKNCLHVNVCIFRDASEDEKVCRQFKNKADMVEVVRCKDCGFIKETKLSINKRPLRSCTLYKIPCYDDHFCSRGVKMDGKCEGE